MPRYIDADALKKDLTRFYDNEVTARELIDEQPTVKAESVKHGRWELISQNKFAGSKTLRCTYCKNYFVVRDDTLNAGRGDANFCTNCGAKMDLKGI